MPEEKISDKVASISPENIGEEGKYIGTVMWEGEAQEVEEQHNPRYILSQGNRKAILDYPADDRGIAEYEDEDVIIEGTLKTARRSPKGIVDNQDYKIKINDLQKDVNLCDRDKEV